MDNLILRNFHQRILPLYPPQAEKFLSRTGPDLLQKVSFRYTFSVEAMRHVSYIIEDIALATPGVTVLHVSFQYLSRLQPQLHRYRQIAKAVKGLWLYYAPDLPQDNFAAMPNTTCIDTTDTALVNYWFVVLYGPGVGMALMAEEIPALAGSDRYYEGFYTFELTVAFQLLTILHQINPDRIPVPPSPEQMTG
jgi:hypothetical protein